MPHDCVSTRFRLYIFLLSWPRILHYIMTQGSYTCGCDLLLKFCWCGGRSADSMRSGAWQSSIGDSCAPLSADSWAATRYVRAAGSISACSFSTPRQASGRAAAGAVPALHQLRVLPVGRGWIRRGCMWWLSSVSSSAAASARWTSREADQRMDQDWAG